MLVSVYFGALDRTRYWIQTGVLQGRASGKCAGQDQQQSEFSHVFPSFPQVIHRLSTAGLHDQYTVTTYFTQVIHRLGVLSTASVFIQVLIFLLLSYKTTWSCFGSCFLSGGPSALQHAAEATVAPRSR
jgi:hypothetical protein